MRSMRDKYIFIELTLDIARISNKRIFCSNTSAEKLKHGMDHDFMNESLYFALTLVSL